MNYKIKRVLPSYFMTWDILLISFIGFLWNTSGAKTIVLCVVIFGLLQIKKPYKLHPVVWILSAAVIGVVFRF